MVYRGYLRFGGCCGRGSEAAGVDEQSLWDDSYGAVLAEREILGIWGG